MAYVLGYWFADGCMTSKKSKNSYHVIFSSIDKELLEKIKVVLGSNYKLYSNKCKSGVCWRLSMSSEKMYNDLSKLGGTERKSLTAKFPNVPKEFLYDFVRGHLDGDGSIVTRKKDKFPQFVLMGTADMLKRMTADFNKEPSLVKRNKGIEVYQYYGKYAVSILKDIYRDATLYMERKFKKYQEALEWENKRAEISQKIIDRKQSIKNDYVAGLSKWELSAKYSVAYREVNKVLNGK
jgi:hypothetical protein